MEKKAADEIPFELGQWVSTEDGYGQVMYVRPFYVEDYETNRKERGNGEFKRYTFICKILCDFKGKVRKNNRINIYTSISKIDKEGAAFVKNIKAYQPDEYAKHIVHDDKVDICGQLFLDYQVINKASLNMEEVEQKLADIEANLLPAFTFKEFMAKCAKQNFPIDLKMLVPYGYATKKEQRIMFRLDPYLYKVKGKGPSSMVFGCSRNCSGSEYFKNLPVDQHHPLNTYSHINTLTPQHINISIWISRH